MRALRSVFSAATLALAAFVTPVSAAVLTPDAGWTGFYFDVAGTPLYDTNTSDASWTFTLTGPAELKVTDAFLNGDVFEIFVNGLSIGLTGGFDPDPASIGDPDEAFGNPYFSWLSHPLGAGDYVITGLVVASPHGSGGAYLRLDSLQSTDVDAPAALALLGLGLVGLGLRRRQTVA